MASSRAFNKLSINRLSVTIKGGRGGALEVAHARILMMRALFLILYCVIGVRLFDLMIIQNIHLDFENKEASEIGNSRPAVPIVLDTEFKQVRADIVDREGVLLATSLKAASLYADPKYILTPEESARALSQIFPDTPYDIFLKKLQKSGRFVWLKRGITPSDQAKILKIGDPGLGFRDEYKRLYSQGELSAHIVGYSNLDGKGVMGIERSFQKLLFQNNEDKKNTDLMPSSSSDIPSLRMTIDIRFQHALRKELIASIKKFNAKAGAGIILDVRNGDVLGLVSLPDFDPHKPLSSGEKAQFNVVTQGVYELGSVFKIFSVAAFLETQKNPLSATFDAREPLKRGRYMIRDYHPEKRVLTLPEVFMVSSNIGTALIGETVGSEGIQSFYKKLGLLDAPDVSLLEIGKPLYPRPWRDINTLTASYGHGIAVSPLQLVSAVATIVNGGYKVTPRFVLPAEEPVENQGVKFKTQIVSQETSDVMRSLMRLVVTDGTAKKAQIEGYDVGGKTGTAEKPGKNGYDRKKLISSFVGVLPMNDPQYVIFVMLDEPKGIKETYGYATAGWTAVPTFAKIVKRIVSLKAIEPQSIEDKPFSHKQSVSNIRYKGDE